MQFSLQISNMKILLAIKRYFVSAISRILIFFVTIINKINMLTVPRRNVYISLNKTGLCTTILNAISVQITSEIIKKHNRWKLIQKSNCITPSKISPLSCDYKWTTCNLICLLTTQIFGMLLSTVLVFRRPDLLKLEMDDNTAVLLVSLLFDVMPEFAAIPPFAATPPLAATLVFDATLVFVVRLTCATLMFRCTSGNFFSVLINKQQNNLILLTCKYF